MAASAYFHASGPIENVHPAIVDFNNATFFWKEFGINPHDLLDYDMDWINKMILIHNMKVEAENSKIPATKR